MNTRFFHSGVWITPDDIDRAILFFCEILGFEVQSRGLRKNGGERLFLSNSAHHYIELLTADNVKATPVMPLHPKGRMRGIPHICFTVDDLPLLKSLLDQHEFEIIQQVPEGLDGYVTSETGEHRILFVRGPADISVEVFEFASANLPLP